MTLTETISCLLPLCRCELCGIGIPATCYGLCTPCRHDLPRITLRCPLCGRFVYQEGICGSCLHQPQLIDQIVSPYRYEYPVDKLIQKFKYQHELQVMLPLASELAGILCSMHSTLPEVIIPVPLHSRRLYSRGFNQALEICKSLKIKLKIPVSCGVVKRTRNTAAMFNLTISERRNNLRGAFTLAHPFKYRSIAIVDDIVTTGATGKELASLFRKAGVGHIQLWSLALANRR